MTILCIGRPIETMIRNRSWSDVSPLREGIPNEAEFVTNEVRGKIETRIRYHLQNRSWDLREMIKEEAYALSSYYSSTVHVQRTDET